MKSKWRKETIATIVQQPDETVYLVDVSADGVPFFFRRRKGKVIPVFRGEELPDFPAIRYAALSPAGIPVCIGSIAPDTETTGAVIQRGCKRTSIPYGFSNVNFDSMERLLFWREKELFVALSGMHGQAVLLHGFAPVAMAGLIRPFVRDDGLAYIASDFILSDQDKDYPLITLHEYNADKRFQITPVGPTGCLERVNCLYVDIRVQDGDLLEKKEFVTWTYLCDSRGTFDSFIVCERPWHERGSVLLAGGSGVHISMMRLEEDGILTYVESDTRLQQMTPPRARPMGFGTPSEIVQRKFVDDRPFRLEWEKRVPVPEHRFDNGTTIRSAHIVNEQAVYSLYSHRDSEAYAFVGDDRVGPFKQILEHTFRVDDDGRVTFMALAGKDVQRVYWTELKVV